MGWDFIDRILTHGNDLCLLFNASVNAYRRLDPHFEAPNQIKASATDRGSMIRIPLGNEKSSRVEVRSVGPDANPYAVLYSVFKTGLDGQTSTIVQPVAVGTVLNSKSPGWSVLRNGPGARASMMRQFLADADLFSASPKPHLCCSN